MTLSAWLTARRGSCTRPIFLGTTSRRAVSIASTMRGSMADRLVEPSKSRPIVRPFGLAFTPDGTLFVTAFGAGENAKQGTLIKISGDF